MYDVRPTSTGGITKNHFMAVSLMSGEPVGLCHRCAMTSRIEYSDAGKIHARRKATPNAERAGDFPGRDSRPPAMDGRIIRNITGISPCKPPPNTSL